MATLSISIRKSANKKGEHRVYIQVSNAGTQAKVPTPWHVTDKEIDRRGNIKNGVVYDELHTLLKDWRQRCDRNGRLIQTWSASSIAKWLQAGETNPQDWDLDILAYALVDADRLDAEGRHGTAGLRRTMVGSVRRYIDSDSLSVRKVTSRWLNDWVKWLGEQPAIGNRRKGSRAASLYIAQLRAVYNKARREFNDDETGEVRLPFDPFARMERIKAEPVKHRAITLEQLRAIIALPDEPARPGVTSRFNLARDVFTLSFMLLGMNAVDIYHCAEPVDGRINYERTKTRTRRADRAAMSVLVPQQAWPLIDRWRARIDTGCLFRFRHMYSSVNDFTRALNLGLKEVGKRVGVEGLTFYAARHTWATLAANDAGIDKWIVHRALNHVDERTAITDIYIKPDNRPIDEANRRVLALVFDN